MWKVMIHTTFLIWNHRNQESFPSLQDLQIPRKSIRGGDWLDLAFLLDMPWLWLYVSASILLVSVDNDTSKPQGIESLWKEWESLVSPSKSCFGMRLLVCPAITILIVTSWITTWLLIKYYVKTMRNQYWWKDQ